MDTKYENTSARRTLDWLARNRKVLFQSRTLEEWSRNELPSEVKKTWHGWSIHNRKEPGGNDVEDALHDAEQTLLDEMRLLATRAR